MPTFILQENLQKDTGCITEALLFKAQEHFVFPDRYPARNNQIDTERVKLQSAFQETFHHAPNQLLTTHVGEFAVLKHFLRSPFHNIPSHYLFYYLHHAIPLMTLILDAHESALKTKKQKLADALWKSESTSLSVKTALAQIATLKKHLDQKKANILALAEKRLGYFEACQSHPSDIMPLSDAFDDDDAYLLRFLKKIHFDIPIPSSLCWSHALTPLIKIGFSSNARHYSAFKFTEKISSEKFELLNSYFFEPQKKTQSAWKIFLEKTKERLSFPFFSGSFWKILFFTIAFSLIAAATAYFFISSGGLIPTVVLALTLAITLGPILFKKLIDFADWLSGKNEHEQLNSLPLKALQGEFLKFIYRTHISIENLDPKDLDHLRLEINSWNEIFQKISEAVNKNRPFSFNIFANRLKKRIRLTKEVLSENQIALQNNCDSVIAYFIEMASITQSKAEVFEILQTEQYGSILKQDHSIAKVKDFIGSYSRPEKKASNQAAFRNNLSDINRLFYFLLNDQNTLLEKNTHIISKDYATHKPLITKIRYYISRALSEAETSEEKRAIHALGNILSGKETACDPRFKPTQKLMDMLEILKNHVPNTEQAAQAIINFLIKIHSPNMAGNFYLFNQATQKAILDSLPNPLQLKFAFEALQKQSVTDPECLAALALIGKALLNAQMSNNTPLIRGIQEQSAEALGFLVKNYGGERLEKIHQQFLAGLPLPLSQRIVPHLALKRLQRAFDESTPFSITDLSLLRDYQLMPSNPPLQLALAKMRQDDAVVLLKNPINMQQLFSFGLIDSGTARLAIGNANTAYIEAAYSVDTHAVTQDAIHSHADHLAHTLSLLNGFKVMADFAALHPHRKTKRSQFVKTYYEALANDKTHGDTFSVYLKTIPCYLGFLNADPEAATALLAEYTKQIEPETLIAMLLNPDTFRPAMIRMLVEVTTLYGDNKQAPFINSLHHALPDSFDALIRNKLQGLKVNLAEVIALFQIMDSLADQSSPQAKRRDTFLDNDEPIERFPDGKQAILLERTLSVFSKNSDYKKLLLMLYHQCTHLRKTVFGSGIKNKITAIFNKVDENTPDGFKQYVDYLIFRRTHKNSNAVTWRDLKKQRSLIIFDDAEPHPAFIHYEKFLKNIEPKLCENTNTVSFFIGEEFFNIFNAFSARSMIQHHRAFNFIIYLFHKNQKINKLHQWIAFSQFWGICATPERVEKVLDALNEAIEIKWAALATIEKVLKDRSVRPGYLFNLLNVYQKRRAIVRYALKINSAIKHENNTGNEYLARLSVMVRTQNMLLVMQVQMQALKQAILQSQNLSPFNDDGMMPDDFFWITHLPNMTQGSFYSSAIQSTKKQLDSGLDAFDFMKCMAPRFEEGSIDQFLSSLAIKLMDSLLPLYQWEKLEKNENTQFIKEQVSVLSLIFMLQESMTLCRKQWTKRIDMMLTALSVHQLDLPILSNDIQNMLEQTFKFLFYLRSYVQLNPEGTMAQLAGMAKGHIMQKFFKALRCRENPINFFLLEKLRAIFENNMNEFTNKNILHSNEKILILLNSMEKFINQVPNFDPRLKNSYQVEWQHFYNQIRGISRLMTPTYEGRDNAMLSKLKKEEHELASDYFMELKEQEYTWGFESLCHTLPAMTAGQEKRQERLTLLRHPHLSTSTPEASHDVATSFASRRHEKGLASLTPTHI